MVQATVETEDLRQFNAANWFQLEAYLKQKAPDDSPFKVERRIELLNGIENARKAHQVNPLFILALAIIGSQWGRSEIARLKNNLFGWGALVSHTFEGAWSFRGYQECCEILIGKIKDLYLTPDGRFFKGTTLKDINVHYSSDKRWAAEVRDIMNDIDAFINSESVIPSPPPPISSDLGILGRYLLLATEGEDIVRLQTQLAALDLYHGSRDGIFEPLTQEAVKRFQLISGLVVDGVVGPETWKALGGSWTEPNPRRLRLAEIALEEANKNLSWTGPDSEPEKYLALLRESMRRKGHIGSHPVFYNWDAAFVLWCCRQAGFDFPEFIVGEPANHWATFALVQTWHDWARSKGYWYPRRGFFPEPGDIVLFDWSNTPGQFNHIGITKNYNAGNNFIETIEGDVVNRTVNQDRNLNLVIGFIRLDEP